ncbi:MAG: hypothetical protein ABEH81_15205 [Halopenitus sp.]
MIPKDPVFIGLLVALLGLFFFLFLLVRRTLVSLREGFSEGKQ